MRETELDPETRGDISVQLRDDTPNAKIKCVFCSSVVLKLGEKPGLQVYRTLTPIIEKAIAKFSRRRESATEITLNREANIVSVLVESTTTWRVNLRFGDLIPPKIGAKREDALEVATSRLKTEIPRFLNGKPHLTIYLKNGNLTAFKHITEKVVSANAKVEDFKKALYENLFAEKVQNQHELSASFREGCFNSCTETRHEDFNVRFQ